MRLLLIHNRYQQAGGEDYVFRSESNLLRKMGHEVTEWIENNDEVRGFVALKTAFECVYSVASERKMQEALREIRPEIVHIHNFFPRLSPSIHITCEKAGVPVVQTLHNYRLLCPSATLEREGRVCEECLGKAVPWPAVRHLCYRGSFGASAAVANMLTIHRIAGTWKRVARYIALSNFAKEKFIEGGLPRARISVKPNFVDPDPGLGSGTGDFALYVGRLSEEKGIDVLIAAWKRMNPRPILKIVGDGPLREKVAEAASAVREIQWIGQLPHQEVCQAMKEASVLILPSIWYEGFPLVVAEAMAVGLPVIASRIGALQEIISDQATGYLFAAGSSEELGRTVQMFFANPSHRHVMRKEARRAYLEKYNAETNYARIMSIYREAMESSL